MYEIDWNFIIGMISLFIVFWSMVKVREILRPEEESTHELVLQHIEELERENALLDERIAKLLEEM